MAAQAFAIGLARAFGGALIFSLPILMTMEMWWLGFSMNNFRLALLLLLTIPLLIGLSHYMGFEDTFGFKDDALDAFVALAVGFVAGAAALALFSVIGPGISAHEIIGKISIQAVPGSIGAMFAQSELGGKEGKKEEKKRHAGYAGEIFIMAAGALFLAFNVAPTEEMILIAHQMSTWHSIALALVSLMIMHAFVYALEFQGTASIPPGTPFWSVFLRYTIVGYAVALLMSVYILWTFGRTEGLAFHQTISILVVLGFPSAVGAAAARLIL
ncbi:MAG: TIGR02587 family membrane protein [Deltaproteobacteria bacterium]|nr:TIGR02587 family membrane protein [Deltaproteobacteria bacterium]